MGLEKAIASGKEHRKPYTGKRGYAKSVSHQCRNHGECDWCKGNRLYRYVRKLEGMKEAEREWKQTI